MGLVVVSLAFHLVLICHGIKGRSISRDVDLEKQVKLLNKPAIKSIQMENGEFFDCVDINKQPALDHPMLRNHTVQMKPSSIPEGILSNADVASNEICAEVRLKEGGCPPGTVPILRIKEEDLVRPKSFSTNANEIDIEHYAITRIGSDAYHGARANFGLYNPHVLDYESSYAAMILANGDLTESNKIAVGWTVNPKLYGDNKTRFFTMWTVDDAVSTGCYDTRCPGFVHTNPELQLGFPITPVSNYKGDQYFYNASVFQDPKTGNWWLVVGKDQYVGYWPKSIFTSLSGFASLVSWGGRVISPRSEAIKPQMGSGHFPNEGFAAACFFEQIMVMRSIYRFEDPNESNLTTFANKPSCYEVGGKTDQLSSSGYSFFFGGPGGLCASDSDE